MSRTRTLENLTSDVRIKADIRSALTRWPDATLYRLVNQGIAALRDLMIEVRGRLYFRKSPPATISTLSTTTRYALPGDFLDLISIRDQETGYQLRAFETQDEGWLRFAQLGVVRPTHYQVQQDPSSTTVYVELLPSHMAGKTFVVDYIPSFTDLVASPGTPNTLEGYQGWEDYPVWWAVREVQIADDLKDKVKEAEGRLAELESRIRKGIPKRDQFRPERVRNVRNPFGRRWP